MDKNTWIGFLLIAAIIVGFSMLNRPSAEEMAERQRIQDSIRIAQQMEAEAQQLSQEISAQVMNDSLAVSFGQSDTEIQESLQSRIAATYGSFAPAAQGETLRMEAGDTACAGPARVGRDERR